MAGSDDTIVALSSGRLPAALGIVRASGSGALALAEALAGSLPEPRQASLRRFVDPASGEEIDRGLLVIFPGPDSATGEDLIEFHLHGSRAVVDAILRLAIARDGVRQAEPGEFTRRALANGRIDLIQAEGLAELLDAETELQRRSAQARAGGDVSRLLAGWRQRLLDISAMAEIAIDYVDEDDGAAAPSFAASAADLADDIETALEAPRVDRLRDGFRIVLAGPPNAGKSSLLNALTRSSRAIVTAVPGTTRDSIEVPLSHGGLPLILVDTAGLRDSDDEVERLGISRTGDELEDADLILWLGDRDAPTAKPTILISPKSDTGPGAADRTAVSALSGEGLDELWAQIHDRIEDRIPAAGQLSLNLREADMLDGIVIAVRSASAEPDPLIASEQLRIARNAFDRLTGQSGVEDLLDALFGRFCVGK